MAKVSMQTVWKMRRMILDGYSVKEVATEAKCSDAVVRKYTASERNQVKEKAIKQQFLKDDIAAHDMVSTVAQMNIFDVVEG